MPARDFTTGRFATKEQLADAGWVRMNLEVKARMDKVAEAVEKEQFRSIFHAAASIAKQARQSIKRGKEASSPGQPPKTRRQNLLRRAIRYHVDKQKQEAVIGPRYSVIGGSAAAHEFGGSYRGERYPARPFMAPALEKNLHRLGGEFTGSIGG